MARAPPEEEAKADSKSVTAKPPTRATKKRGITAGVASQKAGGGKKLERISKKRTKNEAKMTKPDTEWKSVEKTKSKPKCEKVN
ncbi:hypothetical protein Tco_1014067 [Tanacetum coccineum]